MIPLGRVQKEKCLMLNLVNWQTVLVNSAGLPKVNFFGFFFIWFWGFFFGGRHTQQYSGVILALHPGIIPDSAQGII